MITRLLLILLFSPVAIVSAAETFTVTLAPRPGVGSDGSGSGTLTVDNQGIEVSFEIEYSDLSGPEIASHIHRADGSIAFELPPGSPKVGVWVPGSLDLARLRTDQLFVLVHSEAYSPGELRGDITSASVSRGTSSWGRVKALYEETER